MKPFKDTSWNLLMQEKIIVTCYSEQILPFLWNRATTTLLQNFSLFDPLPQKKTLLQQPLQEKELNSATRTYVHPMKLFWIHAIKKPSGDSWAHMKEKIMRLKQMRTLADNRISRFRICLPPFQWFCSFSHTRLISNNQNMQADKKWLGL